MRIRRLTATASILLFGGLVILGGYRVQSGTAEPLPPTPQTLTDESISDAPEAVTSTWRAMTITLIPTLADVFSTTWPARVDDAIYNRRGGTGSYILLPNDACQDRSALSWKTYPATQDVALDCINSRLAVTPSTTLITLTYKTRTLAIRANNLVTMMDAVKTSNPGGYMTATFNLIYERYFPYVGRDDYWGGTLMALAQTVPPATSVAEGNAQWVKTQADFENQESGVKYYYYTSTAVVIEPLLGSDLTVTQLLVNPLTPTIGTPTYFTAVVKNQGTATAWRWFANEVYVRPVGSPPPATNWDHEGGWHPYAIYAILKPDGKAPNDFNWEVTQLAPGELITLQTAITFTTELGNYRVYAQADVGFPEDPGHYAIAYGSIPEGMGVSPYREENNVLEASRRIFIPGKYLMNASPSVITRTAAPGRQAIFDILVTNRGNLTDTYFVTAPPVTTWPVTVISPTLPLVPPGQSRLLTVRIAIPAGTPEGVSTLTLITIHSSGDVALKPNVSLNAEAKIPRIYLPLIVKNK